MKKNDEINDGDEEEEKMRRKKSFHISQPEPPQQAPRSRIPLAGGKAARTPAQSC